MNTLGKRLREERVQLRKSQTEFGLLGGVLKGAQINYEQDKRQPDAAYLSAISAAGADALYILTGTRSAAAPALRVEQEQAGYAVEVLSKEEQALLDHYRHCSDEMRQAAKAQLAAMAKPKGKIKKAG